MRNCGWKFDLLTMATYEETSSTEENNSSDCFTGEFKKYKKRRPPPDFSEVIDFDQPEKFCDLIEEFQLIVPERPAPKGLIDVKDWKGYRLKANPGFLFISNPFVRDNQRYWVRRCLKDFPVKPNHTNLDIHMKLSENDNIWEDPSLENANPFAKGSLLSHLRWATLGYHYEWNNQLYFEDKVSAFPSDLAELTQYIAATLGYPDFSPESGIVNFYNMESNLCGHTDHSEYDKRAPLISYSFGQSAVFLIGGSTKADKPVALYLKSGDICVMMEEARLSYHAVPRIISTDPERFDKCFQEVSNNSDSAEPKSIHCSGDCFVSTQTKDEQCHEEIGSKDTIGTDCGHINENRKDSWKRFENFIKSARINLNVRQVLEKGKTFPKTEGTSES